METIELIIHSFTTKPLTSTRVASTNPEAPPPSRLYKATLRIRWLHSTQHRSPHHRRPPPPPPPPSHSLLLTRARASSSRYGHGVAGDSGGGEGADGCVGLQGEAGGESGHRRVGVRGDDPRGGAVRADDHARHRRQPGAVHDRDDAPRQCRRRQHGHQLHRHLLHALPPRRLHRRHLPRPLPHHRHLRRRPSHGGDDTDDLDGGAGAEAAGVQRPQGGERGLRGGERDAAGGALPGSLPDGARHRRAQVERVRVRLRPVRRVRRRRAQEDDAILQLVLLLRQPRRAARRHRAGVRPGQRRPPVGLRHLRRRHPRRPRRVPLGNQEVPVQEAGGEPAHPGRRRHRRRLEQALAAAAVRPRHALRRRRRRRRRPGRQGQAEAATQQGVPVPGPRGDRRPCGGGGAGDGEQVDAVHEDGCGGGEAGGADAPHLGHHHHVLDHPCTDDHLRRRPGRAHGPPRRRLHLPHPGGLPHRLPHRLHPPHRAILRPPRRARGAPRHWQPARALPAPARVRGALLLHRRHGRGGSRRAPPRHVLARRRRALGVPAHAAVPPRRRRRGVHLHGPARLLPPRVPQGDENHEHGTLPQHLRHRLLLQHASRHHRAQDHRPWRPRRLARRQPRQRQARLLLLAARRDQRHQPRPLHRRRQGIRLQGEAPRRRWHRARRRGDHRRRPLIVIDA